MKVQMHFKPDFHVLTHSLTAFSEKPTKDTFQMVLMMLHILVVLQVEVVVQRVAQHTKC